MGLHRGRWAPWGSWRWFLTKNFEGKNLGPSEGSNEDTKLGHEEVSGFTKRSFRITWGHIEVNRFTKRSSRITLGYIEVGVLTGVMEVVSE